MTKTKKIKFIKDVEQLKILFSHFSRNIKQYNSFGKHLHRHYLMKLNIVLPNNLAILPLGIYPKENICLF